MKTQLKLKQDGFILVPNLFDKSEIKKILKYTEELQTSPEVSGKEWKFFEKSQKILLLEILWEIILADGEIHDYESNLIRRLAGLMYISDIDCGNAKKRALAKIDKT